MSTVHEVITFLPCGSTRLFSCKYHIQGDASSYGDRLWSLALLQCWLGLSMCQWGTPSEMFFFFPFFLPTSNMIFGSKVRLIIALSVKEWKPNHTTHEGVEIAEFPDGGPSWFPLGGYICTPQASSSFNVSVDWSSDSAFCGFLRFLAWAKRARPKCYLFSCYTSEKVPLHFQVIKQPENRCPI